MEDIIEIAYDLRLEIIPHLKSVVGLGARHQAHCENIPQKPRSLMPILKTPREAVFFPHFYKGRSSPPGNGRVRNSR